MTKFEKLSIIFSSIALLLAFIFPFIDYFLLDPTLQAYKHRPQLLVQEIESSDTDNTRTLEILIQNIGLLPTKELKIAIQPINSDINLPPKSNLRISPPSPHEIEMINGTAYLTIERAFGSENKLTVSIPGIKVPKGHVFGAVHAWVYSDIGMAIYHQSFRGSGASGKW